MTSPLPPERLEDIRRDLGRVLKADKPWKSPHLSAEVLARIVGTKRERLTEVFRADGTTFWTVINGCRLEEAVRLLRGSASITIGEAARQAGFGCETAFLEAYKKKTGKTPAEDFRKQH